MPRRAGTGIRFAGVEDPSDEDEEEDRRSNGSGRRSNSGRPSGGAIGAGAGSAAGGVRAPRDSFERGNGGDGLAAATAVDASVSVVTPMLLQPDGIVGPMVPADAASAMEMMDITEFAEFVSDMPWRERTYLVAQFRVRKVRAGWEGWGGGVRAGRRSG